MTSSTPHMPTDVGAIDFFISDEGSRSKIMNWSRFEFVLNSLSNDIGYRSKWFRFYLSTHSNFEINLFEIPDTTLWMTLYRPDAAGSMIEIGISKGGAQEQFKQDLQTGQYYVKVECEPNVRHLPDGTNIGRISFRALPIFVLKDPFPNRTDFGELSIGAPQSMAASFYYFNDRDMGLATNFKNGLSPVIGSESSIGRSIVYKFNLRKKGVVVFGINRVDTFNWPPFITGVYLDGIEDVANGSRVIGSGNHIVVVGDRSQPSFQKDDTYCRYDAFLNLINYF